MDLLFSRYASPFLLLDNYIQTSRFLEFVLKLIDINNDEKIYDVWIHKVYDQSYEDFKESINSKNEGMDEGKLETTINESKDILNGFNLEIQGGE